MTRAPKPARRDNDGRKTHLTTKEDSFGRGNERFGAVVRARRSVLGVPGEDGQWSMRQNRASLRRDSAQEVGT
jgi:hypothetical protein